MFVSSRSLSTLIIILSRFGGGENKHYYNDTWSFDISTRKWTELQCTGSIPSPCSGHAAVLVDGFMYVFGGYTGRAYLDDLIGLHLSSERFNMLNHYLVHMRNAAQKWFKFQNVGQSPHVRSGHAMASDGTHVFVLGGDAPCTTVDGLSFIHVFDTSMFVLLIYPSMVKQRDVELVDMQLKFWDMQANLEELLLSRDQQVGQHEMELTDMRGKLEAKESELEALRLQLTDTEKGWTSLDELVASHDQQVGQHEKELTDMRGKLDGKEFELEAFRLRLTDAEKGWKLLDDLVASHDQQVGRLEKELTDMRSKLVAKESESEAVRLRLIDAEKGWKSLDELAASRDQQVAQHEKELASVHAKFESELEAVRLRLTDAEKGWTKSKADADTLRAQTATNSANRDEDQVTSKLMEVMERMRVIEDEMASRRWNEKIIIDRNEG